MLYQTSQNNLPGLVSVLVEHTFVLILLQSVLEEALIKLSQHLEMKYKWSESNEMNHEKAIHSIKFL